MTTEGSGISIRWKVAIVVAFAAVIIIGMIRGGPFTLPQQSDPKQRQAEAPPKRVFSDSDKAFAQRLIQANGYDCTTVENMRDYLLGGGFVIKCFGRRGQEYWFNIEDQGGKWFVEYK